MRHQEIYINTHTNPHSSFKRLIFFVIVIFKRMLYADISTYIFPIFNGHFLYFTNKFSDRHIRKFLVRIFLR